MHLTTTKLALLISIFFHANKAENATESNSLKVLERFKGNWKEDPSKREGFDAFLAAAEVDETIKKVATSTPWTGEKVITVNGNVVDVTGKTGPNLPGIFNPTFSHHLVVDNTTISEVDLKVVPGKAKFVVEVQGDSLVSRGINVPIICKRTIVPSNPDELIQEVTHVGKQVTAKEVYNRA